MLGANRAFFRRVRRPVAIGLAALLAMIAVSCGREETGSADAPSAGALNAASEESALRIGETGELFGFRVRVDRVETAESYNKQILREGTVFVLVHVALENTAAESKTYDSASFDLRSSNSEPDLSVTTLASEGELHRAELAPGEAASGILPFEHPRNDSVMRLEFRPNPMSERAIVFDLSE